MSLEYRPNRDNLHKIGRVFTTHSPSGTHHISSRLTSPAALRNAPEIPAGSLFNFDEAPQNGDDDARQLPKVADCATHLELLEVFYVLRQRILTSKAIDEAMGIAPKRETKTGHNGDTKVLKDETLWDRRQQKWTKFLEFASVRFLAWRQLLKKSARVVSADDDDMLFDLGFVPPLDIIMVWHSFMLNPLLLSKHCRGEPLMKVRMPWQDIHESINSRDWTFTQSAGNVDSFERAMGMPADLYEQFSTWLSYPGESSMDLPMLSDFKLHSTEPPRPRTYRKSLAGKYIRLFQSVNADLAIELRDAVVRQAVFVDKMNAHLWIRSPAVDGTIRRGIDRYVKFLNLLKLYPSQTIVPTLDIDLVWHTHQCISGEYDKAMKAIVGRFINHNDTLVKEALGDGFATSKKLFRVHYGKEYRVCGCWDCEALLSALEQAVEQDNDEVDMAAIAQWAEKQVTLYRGIELAIRDKAQTTAS